MMCTEQLRPPILTLTEHDESSRAVAGGEVAEVHLAAKDITAICRRKQQQKATMQRGSAVQPR